MTRAGLVLDAADQFWQDWVVGYDSNADDAGRADAGVRYELPFSVVRDSREKETSVRAVRAYAVESFIICVGRFRDLYGPTLLRKLAPICGCAGQRGKAISPTPRCCMNKCSVLERRGLQKPPWLTPAEFARVLPASELALLVEDLTGPTTSFARPPARRSPAHGAPAASDRNARSR